MKMVTEKQGSVFILLDDLARAMQTDDADEYEPEWEGLARAVEDVLNDYVQGTKATVTVNGVNLFGVCCVAVDAYKYRDEDSKDDCTVGLLFYGRGNNSRERALLLVDAAGANLRLRVCGTNKDLICIDRVDKLGREF